MLNLNFGLNFEALAEDLMILLKSCWNDPFQPPVIIFPDPALEQWFKLKWVEKYGVLANLNTQFLDNFLFHALLDKDAEQPCTERLSGELLQNIILAWFRKKDTNGKENWQTFEAGQTSEIQNYLTTNDGQNIDESRLFDLATQISHLFMEYETSRPSTFILKEGIIRTWGNCENNTFFKNANSDRESWQRLLYKRIFTDDDCILTHINQILADKKQNIQYITLPRLFENNRDKQGNVIFKGSSDVPVFMFWHAGIGQFYRVALHEYSKLHDIHVYIQNPCMEFWEDIQNGKPIFKHSLTKIDSFSPDECDEFDINSSDNMLLGKWGRAGRDNIKLWCESVNYDFTTFDDTFQNDIKTDYSFHTKSMDNEPEISRDTLLHRIQYSIAHRLNSFDTNALNDDNSLTIHAAPSKIREIENLHSEICKLIKSGANTQDMLIVAPNINDYRTAIYQVFAAERSQAEANRQIKRNHEPIHDAALYIPFTILDGASHESLIAQALETLFKIASKGGLSRLEFFELIRNPVVQITRGIHPDEISAWEGWLSGMNVFRDRQLVENDISIPYKDWKSGIKRLLLAKLTDNRIRDGEDILIPYSDLESTHTTSLCHFVDAVDSLEEFCESCNKRYNTGIHRDTLDETIIPFLNSWIAMDQIPGELSGEYVIYQNVIKGIEGIKIQYDAGINSISLKCLELTVLNAAKSSRYMSGSIFVNGLTFMNFTSNRVLPVKHLFFLGLDATGFPGHDSQNSLDLRMGDVWPGDIQNASKNRYAFLSQLMNTAESMHLSYVNKNLQKDEDYFPSGIINDLFSFIDQSNPSILTTTDIPLDETRPLNELFTSRSLRNREVYLQMTKSGERVDKINSDYDNNDSNPFFNPSCDMDTLPDRVTLNQIRKYLNDPFQFRISELLQHDDNDPDPQKIVYEPIDIDNIKLINVIKIISQLMIRMNNQYSDVPVNTILSDGTMTKETVILTPKEAEQKIQCVMNHFIRELRETGFRVSEIYEKLLEDKIRFYAQNIAIQMIENNLVNNDDDNDINLSVQQEIGHGNFKSWQLYGVADWHLWNKDSNTLRITAVTPGNCNDICYKYLSAYTCALALIVQNKSQISMNKDEIHVELYLCCTNECKTLHKDFTITEDEAEILLKEIYKEAYITQFFKAAPIKILEDKLDRDGTIKPQINSFEKLEEQLKNNYGPWNYFKKGKIFDLRTEIGYDSSHHEMFIKQWNAAKDHQNKLIYPLKPIFVELIPEDSHENAQS